MSKTERKFIVISAKHSDQDGIVYWRPDNAGYTYNPWQAGIYTEQQIKENLDYYCSGGNTAVDVNNTEALRMIGVMKGKIHRPSFDVYNDALVTGLKPVIF